MKGKVKFFNGMKNFGFITGEDEKEYFVHQSAVADGVALKEGDDVEFEVVEDSFIGPEPGEEVEGWHA